MITPLLEYQRSLRESVLFFWSNIVILRAHVCCSSPIG